MKYEFARCQIVPLPGHQVSFQIDGQERLRWHFGESYPRPFFYPLRGPSGSALTRMGHPGASNHDHHRSIWFAHHKVSGIDFWSDGTAARIRQKMWLRYRNGEREAVMATLLGWYDSHDARPLLEQELIAAVLPGENGETFLELQTSLRPTSQTLEFGETNFGFLAVRVAASISAHFGGGELTSSEGARGEENIFGKPACWMDYSGPVPAGQQTDSAPMHATTEGITYFDHPANPSYPSSWHVREDGWMGASVCRGTARTTSKAEPLTLRYLLHAHSGQVDPVAAERIADDFAQRPGFVVSRATAKHQQFEVERGPQKA